MKTISSFHQSDKSTGIYTHIQSCLRGLLSIKPPLHYSFLTNLLTQLSPFLFCNIIGLYWILSICLKTCLDIVFFSPLTYRPPQILFIFSASPTVNLLRRAVNMQFPRFYFPFAALFNFSFPPFHWNTSLKSLMSCILPNPTANSLSSFNPSCSSWHSLPFPPIPATSTFRHL